MDLTHDTEESHCAEITQRPSLCHPGWASPVCTKERGHEGWSDSAQFAAKHSLTLHRNGGSAVSSSVSSRTASFSGHRKILKTKGLMSLLELKFLLSKFCSL